jgi:hypothetical protein
MIQMVLVFSQMLYCIDAILIVFKDLRMSFLRTMKLHYMLGINGIISYVIILTSSTCILPVLMNCIWLLIMQFLIKNRKLILYYLFSLLNCLSIWITSSVWVFSWLFCFSSSASLLWDSLILMLLFKIDRSFLCLWNSISIHNHVSVYVLLMWSHLICRTHLLLMFSNCYLRFW